MSFIFSEAGSRCSGMPAPWAIENSLRAVLWVSSDTSGAANGIVPSRIPLAMSPTVTTERTAMSAL